MSNEEERVTDIIIFGDEKLPAPFKPTSEDENLVPANIFKVNIWCPECEDGFLIVDYNTRSKGGVKHHRHTCNGCGHHEWLTKAYPCQEERDPKEC